MFQHKELNKLKINWVARKINRIDDSSYEIVYENKKGKGKNLKEFILEEKSKNSDIYLNYHIDGMDFSKWLKSNYFEDHDFEIEQQYENNLSFCFNHLDYQDINFSLFKIMAKRALGQTVDLEDCTDYHHSRKNKYKPNNEKKIIETGKAMMQEENMDTILFCCTCCGDRMCGYIGIQIYHSESQISWQLRTQSKLVEFRFSKTNYLNEFKELIDLINRELSIKNGRPINIYKTGATKKDMNEKIKNLFNKHKNLSQKKLEINDLKNISKTENLEDIDSIIHLIRKQGLHHNEIKEILEKEYSGLSKKEKNSISWKMLDNEQYFNNLDLENPILVKKAFLLYS